MNQRPAGVTLIAIIFIGLGILSLLWSGLIFGVGGLSSLFAGLFNAENIAAFAASSTWAGFLGILAAACRLCWFWPLALKNGPGSLRWSNCCDHRAGVVGMLSSGLFVFLCGVFGLLIPIGMLIYLLRRRRAQYLERSACKIS
jgi:hypothetical protein